MISCRCFVNVWVDIHMKNHNSIMFVWGLFCTLRIALKPDRKYAVRLISKTAISSSEEQTTTRLLYGTGFEASMAVQLFKTLLNQILIIIPAKWNIAIVWLFRTGQTTKKPTQGRVG